MPEPIQPTAGNNLLHVSLEALLAKEHEFPGTAALVEQLVPY